MKRLNEELFTYPGPKPVHRETAIPDDGGCSRSCIPVVCPNIRKRASTNLVEKIIDSQVEEGFFKECPITFKGHCYREIGRSKRN